MTTPTDFDTKTANAEAKAAFIEMVKAMARRRARLDLLPPAPVNDNDEKKGTRGSA